MPDRPLRELIVEPGDYQVRWDFAHQDGSVFSVEGDIALSPDRPPTGTARGSCLAQYDTAENGARSAGFPQQYSVPLLTGTTANGRSVTLFDASIHVWADSQALLSARAALVGRHPWPRADSHTASVEVQLHGLDAITSVPPIHALKSPDWSKGAAYLEGRWEVVGNPASTQHWEDDDAIVELAFRTTMSPPNGFFFRLAFVPTVLITPTAPQTLGAFFEQWIEPLRRLVSLSTGRREELTFVTARPAVDTPERFDFQVFGTAIHQDPYFADQNAHRSTTRAFLIGAEHESLLQLLRRWQSLALEHHPLLETYASMMYAPEQHPRNRLLLLIQALEGMHGFEHRSDFEQRTASHLERRAALLEQVRSVIGGRTLRFLKDNLSKVPARGLQTVLRDTIAGLPVDLTPRLEDSALVHLVTSHDRSPTNAYDALRMVRNDLAHGTRGYDVAPLHEAAEILERVVRSHMLRIVGSSEESQRIELDRSE